jgi:hypothetical protein
MVSAVRVMLVLLNVAKPSIASWGRSQLSVESFQAGSHNLCAWASLGWEIQKSASEFPTSVQTASGSMGLFSVPLPFSQNTPIGMARLLTGVPANDKGRMAPAAHAGQTATDPPRGV